jgi:hypothetical protein
MAITGTGYIGIGSTSPAVALDLVGVQHETQNTLGGSVTNGIVLQNNTAATAGSFSANRQNSPAIASVGQGWSDGSSASQTVEWQIHNEPVYGLTGTNTSSLLVFQPSVTNSNGGISFCSNGGTNIPKIVLDGSYNSGSSTCYVDGGVAGLGSGGNGLFTLIGGGVEVANVSSTGFVYSNTTQLAWASVNAGNGMLNSSGVTDDTGLARDAAGVLEVDNGTSLANSGSLATLIAGHVGIGTTSPQASLDVSAYARLTLQSSQPVACSSTNAGALALNHLAQMCACNGTSWIFADSTGASCSW